MVDTRDLETLFEIIICKTRNQIINFVFAMKKKCQYTQEDVQNAVNNNKSIAGVLRDLGLRPTIG